MSEGGVVFVGVGLITAIVSPAIVRVVDGEVDWRAARRSFLPISGALLLAGMVMLWLA